MKTYLMEIYYDFDEAVGDLVKVEATGYDTAYDVAFACNANAQSVKMIRCLDGGEDGRNK